MHHRRRWLAALLVVLVAGLLPPQLWASPVAVVGAAGALRSQPQGAWEYTTLDIGPQLLEGTEAVARRLRPAGQEGWEATAIIGTVVILRRPLEGWGARFDYTAYDIASRILQGGVEAASTDLDALGGEGWGVAAASTAFPYLLLSRPEGEDDGWFYAIVDASAALLRQDVRGLAEELTALGEEGFALAGSFATYLVMQRRTQRFAESRTYTAVDLASQLLSARGDGADVSVATLAPLGVEGWSIVDVIAATVVLEQVEGAGPSTEFRVEDLGAALFSRDAGALDQRLAALAADGWEVAGASSSFLFLQRGAGAGSSPQPPEGPATVPPVPAPALPAGEIAIVEAGDIVLLTLADGERRALTQDGTVRGLAWSPDGRTIAYDSEAAGNRDIYRLEVQSGSTTQITSGPDDESLPTFAPDGTLYYVRQGLRPAGPSAGPPQQVIERRASGEERVIYSLDGGYVNALSVRDDDRLALSVNFCCDASYDVWVIDVAAPGGALRVSEAQGAPTLVYRGRWSTGGALLAYSASVGFDQATAGLYVMEPGRTGAAPRLIYEDPDADGKGFRVYEVAWSPDERWLLFSREAFEEEAEVWIVEADGGPAQLLARLPSTNQASVAWRPPVGQVPPPDPVPPPSPEGPRLVLEDVRINFGKVEGTRMDPEDFLDQVYLHEETLRVSELKVYDLYLKVANRGQDRLEVPAAAGSYTVRLTVRSGDTVLETRSYTGGRDEGAWPMVSLDADQPQVVRVPSFRFARREAGQATLEVTLVPDPTLGVPETTLKKAVVIGDLSAGEASDCSQAMVAYAVTVAGTLGVLPEDLMVQFTEYMAALKLCGSDDTDCFVKALGNFLASLIGDLAKAGAMIIEALDMLVDPEAPEQYRALTEQGCVEASFLFHTTIEDIIRSQGWFSGVMTESPVYPLVTDSAGRQAGFREDGSLVLDIPGAHAAQVGERRVVIYPGAGPSRVAIVGYETGKMNLHTVFAASEGSPSTASYFAVPVTPAMRAEVRSDAALPQLTIDRDADGSIDLALTPGPVSTSPGGGAAQVPPIVATPGVDVTQATAAVATPRSEDAQAPAATPLGSVSSIPTPVPTAGARASDGAPGSPGLREVVIAALLALVIVAGLAAAVVAARERGARRRR